MMNTTFSRGLSAIAGAADIDALDQVRRTVADHGQAGRLTADQVAALVTVCRARALELAERDAAAPAPVVMTLAAAAPAPAARAGVPAGFVEGEYAAVVASAVERDYDDSGTVLLLTLTADVDGEPVEVRVRFDGQREAARAAAFRSCGLLAGSDPSMLIGKPCRVLLAPWTSSDGRARLVVKRWVAPPKSAAPAAPAAPRASVVKGCNTAKPPKSSKPAWESDSDIPF
jgi:hypothetical protein